MAQHDYDVANGSGAAVRADLNLLVQAVATLNSGAAAPSVTFGNMFWFDTTNHVLKQRNEANSAWNIFYEEGVFTPTILFGGASVGITYGAVTNGRFTRIGRTVFVSGTVTLTSKGTSTGSAQIGGIPYVAYNDTIPVSATIGFSTGFSSVIGSVLGLVVQNTQRISLYQSANGSATGLTNAHFSNSSAVYFSAAYDAA